MKSVLSVLGILILLVIVTSPVHAETRLRMSTTTSTEASGLLNVLLPPFEKANNCKVDVIAVGTGKALKLGENGDVDVVFVHARQAEDKFVADGFGVDRKDVMYNDFVIVGPKEDPSKVKEPKRPLTHSNASWKGKLISSPALMTQARQNGETALESSRCHASRQMVHRSRSGHGPVLQMAFDKKGYTLADRGTFIAYEGKIDSVIVFEGDRALFNPYGVIAVNPQKHPKTNYELAKKFIDYVTGPDGQKVIADFKLNGKQLFFPDAKKP